MKIKVISQQYNPLLRRKEIIFEIEHKETKGTPTRYEVRKNLAEKLKSNIELLYVRKVETKTGTMLAAGEANLYDSSEQVKLVEPEHIINRNMPPEKTPEEPHEKPSQEPQEKPPERPPEEKEE